MTTLVRATVWRVWQRAADGHSFCWYSFNGAQHGEHAERLARKVAAEHPGSVVRKARNVLVLLDTEGDD